jgi:hypothetical protein
MANDLTHVDFSFGGQKLRRCIDADYETSLRTTEHSFR